mmetsp:Transcript_26876/g.77172  ORF Transcript_26876/g.77172 Transcript_26876/m.77172 type:complete len:240 (+) Transcript_26876:2-721(+)
MPVESGHRLVLSYNLRRERIADQERERLGPLPTSLQDLVDMLREHFKPTKDKKRASRFVFRLEHDYTPSSVGPDFLKGTDAALYQLLARDFNVSFEMLNEYKWFDDPASYSLIGEAGADVLRTGTADISDEEKDAVLRKYWEDNFRSEVEERFDSGGYDYYERRRLWKMEEEGREESEEEKAQRKKNVISKKRDQAIGNWRNFLADAQIIRQYAEGDESDSDALLCRVDKTHVSYVFPV